MNDELKILELAEAAITENCDKIAIAREIMNSFIFGPVATNVHYRLKDIHALVQQKYLELFPLPVEEIPLPVVEKATKKKKKKASAGGK